MPLNIALIGGTGTGKSEIVKSFIPGKNVLAFDPNDEYGPNTKYPNQKPLNLPSNNSLPRSRYIGGDFDEFVRLVLNKKNTVCVFEEATGFIDGRLSRDVKKVIINRLFSKNTNIFIFHSVMDCPPGIMRLMQYVVLFRTADEPHFIESKYPKLVTPFLELQKQPVGTKKIIKQ